MGHQGTCHVVSAAPASGALALPLAPGDLVIAADGGYDLCRRSGVPVDVLIGDFDSLDRGKAPRDGSVELLELPCAKDDTDTIAALREGLSRGYRRFEIHAALGGDVGHELANVQALCFLREHGARGTLHGGGQSLMLVFPEDGPCAVATRPGMRVSVLAFAGTASGVCERGLRWELSDAVLEPGFPVGVSNEALGDAVCFSVGSGALLVVLG